MDGSEENSKFKNVIDSDKRPDYWDDDKRMEVMLAPFRVRDLNPVGYDRKMEYWKKNIEFYCSCNDRCSFTLTQLKSFFVRNGRSPYCLEPVVEELRRERTVQLVDEFLLAEPPKSLVESLIKSPVQLYYKMWSSFSSSQEEVPLDENATFIHLPELQKKAEKFLSIVKPMITKGKLFTYQEFEENTQISRCCIRWIVHWLELKQKAQILNPDASKGIRDTLIKVPAEDEPVPAITEAEIAQYALRRKEEELIGALEKLENDKIAAYDEVKMYLKKGMRQMAKASLKKEKEIEKQIIKKITLLENIRSFTMGLEESEHDAKILNTYKVVVDTMKKNSVEKGMNLDNVDDTMQDLAEVMGTYSEIQSTIGKQIMPENEEDLEDELAELLLRDTPNVPPSPPSGRKKGIDLDDLPSAPSTSPREDAEMKRRAYGGPT